MKAIEPVIRNVDIIREILLRASVEEDFEPKGGLAEEHTALLIDLGYLAGQYLQESEGRLSYIEVMGLTRKGRALLEAVRNEAVWRKTKRKMGDTIDRMPLEKVREAAEEVVRHA